MKSTGRFSSSWERASPGTRMLGIGIALVLGLGLVLVFAMLIGYLLPWIVAGFVVAAPLEYFSRARARGESFGLSVLDGLRAMIVFPVLTAGLGAPFRAVMLVGFHIYFKYGKPGIILHQVPPVARIFLFWSPFDVVVAALGIAFGIIATGVTIYLILAQVRQIDNLPTSKARSAALGLSEFKGVARPAADAQAKTEISNEALFKELGGPINDPLLFYGRKNPIAANQPITTTHKLGRFYLEDDTGRILVDPAGAQFWDGESASFIEPLCKMLLTRRAQKSDPPLKDSISTAALWSGDPVYVLGYVEQDPEASRNAVGSEGLVVRPCTAPIKRTLFNWLFFNSERFIKSRDYRYLFLISDAYEYQVREILLRGIKSILVPGLIWTVGSAALLGLALMLLRGFALN